jgi:hypothetical protein
MKTQITLLYAGVAPLRVVTTTLWTVAVLTGALAVSACGGSGDDDTGGTTTGSFTNTTGASTDDPGDVGTIVTRCAFDEECAGNQRCIDGACVTATDDGDDDDTGTTSGGTGTTGTDGDDDSGTGTDAEDTSTGDDDDTGGTVGGECQSREDCPNTGTPVRCSAGTCEAVVVGVSCATLSDCYPSQLVCFDGTCQSTDAVLNPPCESDADCGVNRFCVEKQCKGRTLRIEPATFRYATTDANQPAVVFGLTAVSELPVTLISNDLKTPAGANSPFSFQVRPNPGTQVSTAGALRVPINYSGGVQGVGVLSFENDSSNLPQARAIIIAGYDGAARAALLNQAGQDLGDVTNGYDSLSLAGYMDFGNYLGTPITRRIQIQNAGETNSLLAISRIETDDPTRFIVTSETVLPLVLEKDEKITVEVRYIPTLEGQDSANLLIQTDDATFKLDGQVTGDGLVTIPLTGAVEASRATLELSLTQIDYGTVPLGADRTANLTVRNKGTTPINLTDLRLLLPTAEWSIDGAASQTIAANSLVTLKIKFKPLVAGPKQNVLSLYFNGSLNPALAVPIKAVASAPRLEVRTFGPASKNVLCETNCVLDFGPVAFGSQAEGGLFVLNAGSGGSLRLTNVELLDNAKSQIRVSGFNGNAEDIVPGKTRAFRVQYLPIGGGGRINVMAKLSFDDATRPEVMVNIKGSIGAGECIKTGNESCDGLDNNCNNKVDEDFSQQKGFQCNEGVGACATQGVYGCNSTGGTICIRPQVIPSPVDLCGDQIDNNCNGATDEGFEKLGQPCVTGTGACQRAGINICAPNGLELICNVEAGAPVPEQCNQKDDDCDGKIDTNVDGSPLTRQCATTCGSGFQLCSNGQWGPCSVLPPPCP